MDCHVFEWHLWVEFRCVPQLCGSADHLARLQGNGVAMTGMDLLELVTSLTVSRKNAPHSPRAVC